MQTTHTDRDALIHTLADTYYDFLLSLPYDDDLFMFGIKEGKEKFLPNLHAHLASKLNLQGGNEKRYTTDYVSPAALKKLRMHDRAELYYEHLLPKNQYTLRPLGGIHGGNP